ncbi:MAG: hypothetical protein IJV67_04245, partial [Clostridia bacterium]|nr:hypothetical protein [Clostridia bacterium]
GEGVATGIIVTYKQTDEGALVYAFNKNNCDSKTVYLSGEFKAVKEISFNGEERVIPAITCEKGGFCRVSIPAGGAKVFVFLFGGDAACGKEYMEELPIVGSCLKDKNCLTIDRASYSFNGTDYSEVKDVISVASEVYSQGGEVFVKYTFINNSDCRNLTLFTENGYNSVTVNGKQPRRCNERFFSARLMSYDVSDCVIKGENSIVLQFDIPKNVAVQTDWEFESLRNIYFLPVEIESVYLVGDFSVGGSVQWATPEYLIGHGPFTLESYKPCSCNEATGTGAPFYRGVMEIVSEVSYSGGEAFLRAEFFGSMAELFINGQSAGRIFDGDRLNVTKWLKTGKNDIKLELYSTNRNLLGAHHHVCGEVKMTGRNTFEGKHGFEDFVNPDAPECTYTESYSFVPFGIKGISLIKIK